MENGEMPTARAAGEIAELLARAYERYARTRQVAAALASSEALDNTGEPSRNGLTLTGQRGHGKESAQC